MDHRTARRLGILTFVLLALGIWTGPAAQAHSDLISSEPGYGDTLAAAPDPVLLHFDEPVELRAAVTELFVDGRRVSAPKPAHANGNKRTVSVVPTVSGPGRYLFRWFFFGYDGHLMAGELKFTVDPDPASAPRRPRLDASTRRGRAASQRRRTHLRPLRSRRQPRVHGHDRRAGAGPEAFDAAGDLPAGFLAPTAVGADESAADVTAAAGAALPAGPDGRDRDRRPPRRVRLAGRARRAEPSSWSGCGPQGATLARARRLLWLGLAGALGSTLLTLGLKGAGPARASPPSPPSGPTSSAPSSGPTSPTSS